jgi:hypothetical protein
MYILYRNNLKLVYEFLHIPINNDISLIATKFIKFLLANKLLKHFWPMYHRWNVFLNIGVGTL